MPHHELPACQNCWARGHCMPASADRAHCAVVDTLVERRLPMARGERLFVQGEASAGRFYAIREGAFKTAQREAAGIVRVTGFHLSGEFLGLDALGDDSQRSEAQALARSVVCEFVYEKLVAASRQSALLAHLFDSVMARALAREQVATATLREHHAERKMALFLLDLAMREHARRGPDVRFALAMSLKDIANYLFLTPSTVSRSLAALHAKGLLARAGNVLGLPNRAALARLAAGQPPRP